MFAFLLVLPLLQSCFTMSEHDHSIEPATRKPLDERVLAIIDQNITETSESIIMANPSTSLESKLVIALGAPKLTISCQTSIDITIIQNLMNPKHTRRPIRVTNGDIMAVARELLQNKCGGREQGGRSKLGWWWSTRWWMTRIGRISRGGYSSTLYTTLKRAYYPLPDTGRDSCAAVSSPGVVIIPWQPQQPIRRAPTKRLQSCFRHLRNRTMVSEALRVGRNILQRAQVQLPRRSTLVHRKDPLHLETCSKQRQNVSGPRSHRLHEQLSTIYGRT